jgi:hypothetical protein
MSTDASPLHRALANQVIAISVSDSPDLGRLGLLERSLRQTVAAIVTRLVSHGARIAYGGNLDRKGYTYQLYPAIAQAYATAALRSARPPFVHYVAAYLAQDAEEFGAHLAAVAGFAEVRLVDGQGQVTRIINVGHDVIAYTPEREMRSTDITKLAGALPRASGGPPADLDAMRFTMEADVTGRIIIGGRVTGYAGSRPGILQETVLALQRKHVLFPLGGFGGAARDAAIALQLMAPSAKLRHPEVGPGYFETLEEIRRFAREFREWPQISACWQDLEACARAEDPEDASRNVLRALSRAGVGATGARA